MGKSVLLAAMLTLLGGVAFAGHAISLEPESETETAPAVAPEPEASAPAPAVEPPPPAPAQVTVVPAPKVEVTFPAEHDLYVVPAATREVCTTLELGFGEIQTDCRMKPIPVRAEDPALRGLCVTRYGRRICY
jgi:hypothetical protein